MLISAGASLASANPSHTAPAKGADCPPSARALGCSDALNKLTVDGEQVGGLSDLAWDPRGHRYLSTVDNHGDSPALVWPISADLKNPHVVSAPIVLKTPEGTPYTGKTADNEGLAVLPDGTFAVSSEVEPSVRLFGRDGVQRAQLPVPQRFRVAPAGQASVNATFEGLTTSPNGHQLIAAMEGSLFGDTGDGTFRRMQVYQGKQLGQQIGYRVDPGYRIPEISEYAPGKLLVLEAAYDPLKGNSIKLYRADISQAPNVSNVPDLAAQPRLVVRKELVSDVTACPTLGAKALQPQTNPLMDNYEGMAVRGNEVALISDDNFNPTQITRLLRLHVTH